jgi:hypothetical protein
VFQIRGTSLAYLPFPCKELPQAFGLLTEFALQTRSVKVSTCGLPKGESLYAEFFQRTWALPAFRAGNASCHFARNRRQYL